MSNNQQFIFTNSCARHVFRDIIMKKTLLSIIVCFACCLTYAEQVTPILTGYSTPAVDSYQKINHLYVDKSENQQVLIEMYDVEDFTVAKQINFSIPETNSDIYRCVLILDQFVMVECEDTTISSNDNKHSLKLFDIEGTIIYDFGRAYEFWVPVDWEEDVTYIWQIASDKLLFMVYRKTMIDIENYIIDRSYEYYTLTFDSSASGTQNVQVEKKAAFPCPARGEVNIPTRGQQGNLRILNLKGQTVDAQRIQEGDYQRVNTESYPAGTYIYQAGNETGKFIVE